MRLSGSEIGTATQGIWHGLVPEAVTGVCTDSRSFQPGNVFLALRGPSFDGHAFAASVADRAVTLIGDHEGVRSWTGLENSKLEVEDTLQAFGDIAHVWRNKLTNTCVIAILGDMAELGESAQAAHAGLDIDGVDRAYLIGKQMQMLAEKYPESRWFANTEDALNELVSITFGSGDAVLVKASRSMHLESVVELLCSGDAHAV